MNFWITFAFFGLIAIPLIIVLLICGANLKYKLGGAFAVLVFWFILAGSLTLDASIKEERWNGGFCECGEHWTLAGGSKSRNGTETKYYRCDNCHNEITI